MDGNSAGWRLDRFLALRIKRLSRARAARLVVVDTGANPPVPLKKSARVREGQRLWAARPLPDAQVDVPEPAVLHRDDDLLVLDKPAGLATHPTASHFVATVTHWLARQPPPDRECARPAHRLDVETSGVLVVARHVRVARFLERAFARGQVEKVYHAVVRGVPHRGEWLETTPLGPATDSAVRLKMGRGDQPSSTAFRVLWAGEDRAIVEARPRTGRQHQIRVHLALAGHPIFGDKLYGPDEGLFLSSLDRPLDAAELARVGHPRQALHAASLTLTGLDGVQRTFTAPWPADLTTLAPGR